MTWRLRGVGGTAWLAAVVGVLLPALAWLQFDWVSQLATADRERRERTLRSAGAQFTTAVDTELSRLGGSLQLDGAMVERQDWDAYALRYAAATQNGAGALVRGVWYAEAVDHPGDAPATFTLKHWSPDARTFESTEWPGDLVGVRDQLVAHAGTTADILKGGPRELFASSVSLGNEETLVLPVLRVVMPQAPGAHTDHFLTDVRLRGFTIIGLALDELTHERVPALVSEYFPESAEYRVAVVTREGERVVFESEPGAAAATRDAPDYTAQFLQPRMGSMMVFARSANGRGGDGRGGIPPPPPIPPAGAADFDGPVPPGSAAVSVIEVRGGRGERIVRARAVNQGRGYWTLRVRHRAGSLEAAVAASRRRNLWLSGSVLALLGIAVVLMSVSARRAQALARQQMEFVAAVSHELRTPVAVINTAAGNLADGVVDDAARVKRYGQTIQAEARRLGDTVERVMVLAGLGSGRTLPMEPLSAGALVHDAVQQTAADIARTGVDLYVEVASDLPSILGDARSMQSAVQNLVGNAVKYAGDDRWVQVRAFSATHAGQPEVHIAVEDHGPGLDADERELVFEPFYRGRRAVADQIHGSGLGLSLVRRIVDAHGGRVGVESGPGGSTFTICIPAAPPATGLTAASPVAAPSAT